MKIDEILFVICILISIRIAEYVMKKYKKNCGKNLKDNRKRKQVKDYLITAPSIFKLVLPCAVFFGIVFVLFILSQIFNWKYVEQIENPIFMMICLMISLGFFVMCLVITLYGYLWKIEYDNQEIIYRTFWGSTRKYRIEDITRCVGKRRNQYLFYQGEKKLFQYELDAEGDIYELLIIMKEHGVEIEELIPSSEEHCIVEPMLVQKSLPIMGVCIVTIFLVALWISKDGKIWMYLLLCVINLFLIYYSGDYWFDKVEVKNKICRKRFLRKTRIVEFSEVLNIQEYRSFFGTEYIVLNVKNKKSLKIRKYSENIDVFLRRLNNERIGKKNLVKRKKNKL